VTDHDGGHPRTPGSSFGGRPRTPGLRRALIAVALAGGLLASACGSTAASAATVNGRTIDRSDFEKELKALAENKELQAASGGQGLLGKGKDTVDARLSAGWLTAVIYDALITDEFDRRKLKLTEEDKGAAEAQLADQFGNPKVAAAFPKWFRERLSGRNARAVAVRTAISGLSLSEESLTKYYDEHKADFEQVCLSHLLVETKEEADAALARVKGGESFAAVATAVSKDQGSAPKGGDLGCNNKGLFVPEFEAAAFSASPEVPTDPVQTQFGFHVLLVTERKTAPFEQARTQAKQALDNESQEKFRDFLSEAAQKAKVTVDPRYGKFKAEPPGAPEVVPPETPAPAEGRPEDQIDPSQPDGIPVPDQQLPDQQLPDQQLPDAPPSTTAP
jgi:parvulin-like peptidyl-prolyl isomerase